MAKGKKDEANKDTEFDPVVMQYIKRRCGALQLELGGHDDTVIFTIGSGLSHGEHWDTDVLEWAKAMRVKPPEKLTEQNVIGFIDVLYDALPAYIKRKGSEKRLGEGRELIKIVEGEQSVREIERERDRREAEELAAQ